MSNKLSGNHSILVKFRLVISLCLLLASFETWAQAPQTIYVRKGATAPGDGSSWSTAFPDLQQALAVARVLPGSKEVWVAQGEYKPTNTLDRTISFDLPVNTAVYGGFNGTESSAGTRNWKSNRTVLSGDLGEQFESADNSFHVVKIENIGSNTVLDGFVIRHGNANAIPSDSLAANSVAGGLYIVSSGILTSPTVSNCLFEENEAMLGGALYIGWVPENIENDSLVGSVSPQIINCQFVKNVATSGGGAAVILNGIQEFPGSPDVGYDTINFPSFLNCVFSSNISHYNIGAAIVVGTASFINCTITANQSIENGSALGFLGRGEIKNSIIWKNFAGDIISPDYQDQILHSGDVEIINNIIQGGYGNPNDNNIDSDPLFEQQPSLIGIYPRTSIIPVSTTDARYENQLSFNGPKMNGPWPYYAYKDHEYDKLYLPGRNLQVIDFSNLTNNQPTSTVYGQIAFGRTQRIDQSVYPTGNKIYFASYFSGIVSLDRSTGQLTDHTPLAGEPITFDYAKARDLVVDDTNGLLYSPIFYKPVGQEGNVFYGLLELDLSTQTKRWINTTSSPLAISVAVSDLDEGDYWGGYRIYLDEPENTLYFSTGNGVWWWNRTDNSTGVISTTGGLSLSPGSPNLPSNFTTGMFMDHTENKFYIGTHEGLFVWNRSNNTSRIYNTSNSALTHNLINHIDKNDEFNLLYVACEEGGLFVINTQTGEEKMITEDAGNEVHPQFMDNSAASVYYDEVDKKLYVSADHASGGVWIQDYNNLIPDYGDLRLKAGSPALDKGNAAFLPSGITTDIAGLNRFVDYTSIEGENSLDLGAHERAYNPEDEPNPPLEATGVNYILTFTPLTEITVDNPLDNFPVQQVNKAITYFDGLGRPMQSIAIQGSPQRKDVITPIVYDEFGREVRKYLPFVSGNNGSYRPNDNIINTSSHAYTGIAALFYEQGSDNKVADDPRPYSQVIFEPSPLNRPDKEYGAGQAWAPSLEDDGKYIQHKYLSNVHSLTGSENAEAIIAWTVDGSGMLVRENQVTDYITSGGFYESNQLYVKVTLDEHGNAVREYTNKQGQVILRKVQAEAKTNPADIDLNDIDEWACTYYVYDDLGNMRYVLPPEGVKQYLEVTSQN